MVNTSDISSIQQELKLPGTPWDWRTAWNISEETHPVNKPFFILPEYVGETCNKLGLAKEITDEIISSLSTFDEFPSLKRFCWHYHLLLFGGLADIPVIPDWPSMGVLNDRKAGLVKLVTLLSGLSFAESFYKKRTIPFSILKDTLFDIEVWMRDYKNRHGELGFSTYDWIGREMKGLVIRLGRLQFETRKTFFPFRAYRNENYGVIILAEEKLKFRSDGQFADADGGSDTDEVWETKLEITEEIIQGYPISPYGKAINKEVTLNRREWKEIIRRDDNIISVHIPAIGPMDMKECGLSYEQAFSFFDKHFPDFDYKGFCCWSWLLDPQFEEWLPSDSNVVRFLKEYYLLPIPHARSKSIYDRVFLCGKQPTETLPQKTTLQKSLVKAMEKGVIFRDGGFYLFREDFSWGNAVYRKMKSQELYKQ